jgi:hypothetical protein
MTDWLAAQFGSTEPGFRGAEWKRLGRFLAFGAAFFVLAVIGAGFVPFSWPDAFRRSAHPMIFVPLGIALTVRMLRKVCPRSKGVNAVGLIEGDTLSLAIL